MPWNVRFAPISDILRRAGAAATASLGRFTANFAALIVSGHIGRSDAHTVFHRRTVLTCCRPHFGWTTITAWVFGHREGAYVASF